MVLKYDNRCDKSYLVIAQTCETEHEAGFETLTCIIKTATLHGAFNTFCDMYMAPLMSKICDPETVAEWAEPDHLGVVHGCPFTSSNMESDGGLGEVIDDNYFNNRQMFHGKRLHFSCSVWNITMMEIGCHVHQGTEKYGETTVETTTVKEHNKVER